MIDLLQKGGPIMWLILLCSITSLAIFLERTIHYHRATINVGDLLRGLAVIIHKKDFVAALQQCASTPGPVARVAHAIILRHEFPRQELRDIAQEAGQLEIPRLERNLPLLATIAYTTPLLGLLGTILGLLQTFEIISSQGGGATAVEIVDDVYWSLLSTAASLSVAIPAFVAHSYLSSRVNSLVRDMERVGIEILSLLDSVAPNTKK